MRLRASVAALAVLLITAGNAAAEPVPVDYVPTFSEAQYWLHGAGNPIGNIDARDGKFLRWDGVKPTSPVPTIFFSNNMAWPVTDDHDTQTWLTIKGVAVGDLQNLAF